VNWVSPEGDTLLTAACAFDDENMKEGEKKAKENSEDESAEPEMIIIKSPWDPVIVALLAAKCNPNAISSKGETCLGQIC